ncbi:hypothetical protein V1527DRAFT_470250 [Lipomyces starkeyi]
MVPLRAVSKRLAICCPGPQLWKLGTIIFFMVVTLTDALHLDLSELSQNAADGRHSMIFASPAQYGAAVIGHVKNH